ncbi:hypothetical protein WKI40_15925 [Kosakonia sacchari]|uniref:hypothetical protein n=1 Tax=Kosakonia sacchari TaxID=1158459 RepID=UPI0030C08D1D
MESQNNDEGERICTLPEDLSEHLSTHLIEDSHYPAEVISINFTEAVDLRLPPYKKRLVHKMANRKQPPKGNNQ